MRVEILVFYSGRPTVTNLYSWDKFIPLSTSRRNHRDNCSSAVSLTLLATPFEQILTEAVPSYR